MQGQSFSIPEQAPDVPFPVKICLCTLQIITPSLKPEKRPLKNKKNIHTANILDEQVLMHISVLFLLKMKPSNQERHLVLMLLTEGGPYHHFSVIALKSMYE